MDGQIQTANEAFLGGGGQGYLFQGKFKNEGNRKYQRQLAIIGTGNTENQYIDYGEQGIKRFIDMEQGRINYPHHYPEGVSLIFILCIS